MKALARNRAALLGGFAVLALPVLAQTGVPPSPEAPESATERSERLARRACAVRLCAILHTRTPDSGVISCRLGKTWRKEALTRIFARGKLAWPWGDAHCEGELKLHRATLVKAMSEGQFDAQFDTHEINCALQADQASYDVKLQVHPKVSFKNGKAVKARMNWGKIEAPRLAKTALWSAAAVDNTFGVLQNTLVEDLNAFVEKKCMEVKEEWQGQ